MLDSSTGLSKELVRSMGICFNLSLHKTYAVDHAMAESSSRTGPSMSLMLRKVLSALEVVRGDQREGDSNISMSDLVVSSGNGRS